MKWDSDGHLNLEVKTDGANEFHFEGKKVPLLQENQYANFRLDYEGNLLAFDTLHDLNVYRKGKIETFSQRRRVITNFTITNEWQLFGITIPHHSCYDDMIIKVIDNKPQWIQLLNGSTDDFSYSIEMDSLGDYYVCGMISNDFVWRKKPWFSNQNVIDTFPIVKGGGATIKSNKPTVSNNSVSNLFDIDLLPNPTDGLINIQINSGSEQEIHLAIIDMTGKILNGNPIKLMVDSGQNNHSMDISHLAKGIYLFQFTSSQGNRTTKVEKL